MKSDQLPSKTYLYKWKQDKIGYFIVLLLCFVAVLLFFYMILEREIGILSHDAQMRLQYGMPSWIIILCLSASSIALWGSYTHFSTFLGKITIDSIKLELHYKSQVISITWNEAEKLVLKKNLKIGARSFSSTREEISIFSSDKKITLYQEIDGFEYVKKYLIEISAKHRIPLFECKFG
jgi:hypothetical protein